MRGRGKNLIEDLKELFILLIILLIIIKGIK